MITAEMQRRSHGLRVYRHLSDRYYMLFLVRDLTPDEVFTLRSTLRMAAYGLLPQAGKMVRHFPVVAQVWRAALTEAAKGGGQIQ